MSRLIQNQAHRGRPAGECVDACRREVLAQADRLPHPITAEGLESSLHASISILLHREWHRLISHDAGDAKYVPEWVHEELGELKELLDLPVLTSVLEGRVRAWRAGLIEMLQRLKRDWPAIVEMFGVHPAAGLSAVSHPLGDLHNAGRSVYCLTFQDGARVIYKPRSVAGEHTLGRVVAWLKSNHVGPELLRFNVLPLPDYGWTGFVPSECCANSSQAMKFFMRQGAFLALFYLLCAEDCTADNLVVARDQPAWIDTECVCTPRMMVGEQETSVLSSWLRESVVGCGLVGTPGSGVRSGLSVSCLSDRLSVFVRENLLRERYVDAVKSGFENIYRCLLERRRVWAGPHGPLTWWQDQPVRVLPRSTRLYARLSDAFLIVPTRRREELRRRVACRLRDHDGPLASRERLVEVEMGALARGDIPYWSTSTNAHILYEAGGASVPGCIARSGMERVFDRAAEMSIASLEGHLWLVDAFLHLGRSASP